MSGEKEQRDLQILLAITGSEDPTSVGMQIEDNYLIREQMENRREQGMPVPDEWVPVGRSQEEIDLWKRTKWLEELEQARTNREFPEYPGNDEEDTMAGKEKTNNSLKLFDLRNQNTVCFEIGDGNTLTLSKIIRWQKGTAKRPRTGVIEKSYIIGEIRTKEGKELKLIIGGNGNVWAGQAIAEPVKQEVVKI